MSSDPSPLQGPSTHPRFEARRAAIEDQSLQARRRKIIAFAAVVLLLLLAVAATQSPLLDVDEVRVIGADRLAADELRRVAALEPGDPILGLDTGAAEYRLEQLPEIASVAVDAGWNGVVTLEIEERVPVARIDSTTGTIVVASDGVVIALLERALIDGGTDGEPPVLEPLPPSVERLPEIAGAMFTTEPGRTLPAVLNDAVVVAAALPSDVAAVTDRIELTIDSLYLRAVGGGEVALGDARQLDEKFEAIRAFLAQADLTCLETLDVRAPSVPVIRRNAAC